MKHVHVKYYFVTDKIKNKEVKVVYCPTDELVADYNSKPLQGKLFYRHRNAIMGVREQDFAKYKELYIEVLKRYDLYDNEEDDLMDI